MPYSINIPKNILLISDSPKHEKVFRGLCEKYKFKIFDIVKTTSKIETALKKQNQYDIIVIANYLNNNNLVDYFYEQDIKINEKIPALFIINEELTVKQLSNVEILNTKLLFENQLNVNFLNYSLKTALQDCKVLGLLKENELRYRSLYDHTLDINLIIDENDMVIDSNVQGRKQLKFEKEFSLKNIFLSKHHFKKFKNLLNEVEQISRFETVIKIKRNNVICLIDAFMLYDNDNQKSGAHLIIRNIDATRKSQILANRASKLLVTGKFLRSLAHEIRNPLTNINLALEQFNQEIGAEDEDTKLYVDIVQRSADRIKDLIEEIMNAYKTSEINLKQESVHNILENAIRFANDRLSLQKIKLSLNFKLKNDIILADKIKLTTAFLNLIVNASEAIEHDNGEITISTSKKENFIIIKVKDNGCGMDEIQKQALFDPFYTGKSKGLGLGLTTAQNVIFAHKGSINVKSKKAKGTSFTVKIPIKS